MRILIIGSGGREHAFTWVLARSPQRPEVLIAPGNAGTAALGENISVAADDLDALVALAQSRAVDLVVVGPEQPLVAGLVDRLDALGIPAVGPTAAAARLEGSKAFAKDFMDRHRIPTARYRTFGSDEAEAAHAYLDAQGAPIVVKASGLAGGKGAVVCPTLAHAHAALDEMLGGRFGAASDEVVIEECMTGEEASLFALTDGVDYRLLATAQDHKRVGEGDTGPNTGGMGAYAPAPIVTEAIREQVCREVIEPVLDGMAREGHPYRGILYVGVMLTPEGPKVVEFNCRLGDPEAQVVLPLLEGDAAELLLCLATGRLTEADFGVKPGAAACVVMASAGYPGAYEKGVAIEGLDEATSGPGAVVFHAGTKHDATRGVVTAGGRVLGVTAHADTLADALGRAYAAVDQVHFEGAFCRRDIGQKGLARLRGDA